MCCTLTHLGIVVASRPHVLHFLPSVLPVKISSNGLWYEHTNKSEFLNKKEHFLIDIKMPKHSFVIAGHLHWPSVKLLEIYATGWTMLDLSWRSCIWDSTLLRGSLSENNFMSASFDSSVEACVSMPEWQNLLASVNNKYGLLWSGN